MQAGTVLPVRTSSRRLPRLLVPIPRYPSDTRLVGDNPLGNDAGQERLQPGVGNNDFLQATEGPCALFVWSPCSGLISTRRWGLDDIGRLRNVPLLLNEGSLNDIFAISELEILKYEFASSQNLNLGPGLIFVNGSLYS